MGRKTGVLTMAEQHERAFQKQDTIFLAKHRRALRKPRKGGKSRHQKGRYWKNVGLGFRTPKEAIEGKYIDKKCPFTSNVIRGRILKGVVKRTKMNKTIIVRRDYLHWIKKYKRFEKRHKNTPAHISPAFRVNEGDIVIIGECRPLSKTVRFNVLKVIPRSGGGKGVKLMKRA